MLKFGQSKKCFCAFCGSKRKIQMRKHISFLQILLSALLCTGLSVVVTGSVVPQILVVFAFLVGCIEVFSVLRWRFSVVCYQCGFDPVLYISNPKLAADRVKNHLQVYDEQPLGFVKKPRLPKISKDRLEKLQKPTESKVLSKTI